MCVCVELLRCIPALMKTRVLGPRGQGSACNSVKHTHPRFRFSVWEGQDGRHTTLAIVCCLLGEGVPIKHDKQKNIGVGYGGEGYTG